MTIQIKLSSILNCFGGACYGVQSGSNSSLLLNYGNYSAIVCGACCSLSIPSHDEAVENLSDSVVLYHSAHEVRSQNGDVKSA